MRTLFRKWQARGNKTGIKKFDLAKKNRMSGALKWLNLPGRVASVKAAWGQATFLDAIKAGGYKALLHGSLLYVVYMLLLQHMST